MGILSNLSRPRGPRLPVYESLNAPTPPTKERYSPSTSDASSPDISDSDLSDSDLSRSASSSSSRPRGSRQPSDGSLSSTDSMLPHRKPGSRSYPPNSRKRKPSTGARRPYTLYRLPNKVVRYLCIGLMTTICLFIFSLVRASQLENRRIQAGKVEKKPPPPPVWEGFRFLTRYYGGIRTLVPLEDNRPQYPRLEDEEPYNATVKINSRGLSPSTSFTVDSVGEIETCYLDAQDRVRVPSIHYYRGRPSGFPDHVVGGYDVLGLPEDICFDRYGKLGPYGFGYSVNAGGAGVGEHGEREGADAMFQDTPRVQWKDVDWADVQKRCYGKNAGRYKPFVALPASPRGMYIGAEEGGKAAAAAAKAVEARAEPAVTPDSVEETAETPAAKAPTGDLPRTAFVVRAWDTFAWREEDILNLRSIISEVALASGGAYDVHLLVEVKNDAANPIWADDGVYRAVVEAAVPREFRDLVTLWSQTQMLSVYQGLHDLFAKGPDHPVHGAYRGLQMAMQWFAHRHPEYDHFWQWEMDVRYTGHYLDLVTKTQAWARQQPRKGLWERNGRFYVPAVHGAWEDFRQMVRVQSESPAADPLDSIPGVPRKDASAASSPPARKEQIVWGPLRPAADSDLFETAGDPTPPTSYDRDRYAWGVGEDADLITFNPLFDPEGTSWGLADDITGYNRTAEAGGRAPPRRAHIITASRMSRRLLAAMHRETAHKKHHAFPEMWPATVALHHGLKAVYAPHPVYVDRAWPVDYLAAVLNGGRNGAAGGSRTSVFGSREHNLRGLSWFYNSGFGGNLYRRWLGLKVNNDGGEEFELAADETRAAGRKAGEEEEETVGTMLGGEGRMCLPPMLLHPVKEIELPVEAGSEAESDLVQSDPAA